jgi:SAM-dependent methyltransferase
VDERTAEAEGLSDRLWSALQTTLELYAVYLGDRLGWYEQLSAGPATAAELAGSTGVDLRYAREWLEQQHAAGLLHRVGAGDTFGPARYRLPAGHAEALLDPTSTSYVGPIGALVAQLDLRAVLHAYTAGTGVAWGRDGHDVRADYDELMRPWVAGPIVTQLGAATPELATLLAGPARVADVGCGHGWSSIALAQTYPSVTVDGIDAAPDAVEAATANAERAGVSARVRFVCARPDAYETARPYDLAVAFEALHHAPDAVGMLAAMRRLAGPDGITLAIEPEFPGEGDLDDVRLGYAFSVTLCLPDAMSGPGRNDPTGTVIRAETMTELARAAGFSDAVPLAPSVEAWRIYRFTEPMATRPADS